MTAQQPTPRKVTGVRRIRVAAPPDHTPEQEQELVASIAAAYEEMHGHREVDIEVDRPEEVDFRAVANRAFR